MEIAQVLFKGELNNLCAGTRLDNWKDLTGDDIKCLNEDGR